MTETTHGWLDPTAAKKVMRSAYIASGATEPEFNAAFLGALSLMVSPDKWAEAADLARRAFRDRRQPWVCAFTACGQPEGKPHVGDCPYGGKPS